MTIQAIPEPVETPIPDAAPVESTPEPEDSTEPAASIAEHAQQFDPNPRQDRPAANTGQFANKPPDAKRHTAASQRATPEDVAEINKLTKELREAEQRVADKDPDAKASPRIRTLRRQLAALRALETPAQTATAAKAEPTTPTAQAATAFEDKEPEIEDFANDPDPYKAWTKAMIKFEAKRDKFEAQQAQTTAATEAEERELRQKYDQSFQAFRATTPDFDAVTGPFLSSEIGPVLVNAIIRSDKQAQFVYHLAQHPALVDELILLTHGKPVTDAFVATVQRRLTQAITTGTPAAPTRSAAPQRTHIAPTPPNLVRTGPVKADDAPPAEGSSIAEHARYYGPKR